MNLLYLAILGFGRRCSDENRRLASEAGKQIADHGIGICAGNLTGTFHYAFEGAKSVSGHTLAIVEKSLNTLESKYCDEVRFVADTSIKHQTIAEKCLGAIVIGGGEGTKKVIDQFLRLEKPVVAIKGSGGIVNSELDKRVTIESDVKRALKIIVERRHIG